MDTTNAFTSGWGSIPAVRARGLIRGLGLKQKLLLAALLCMAAIGVPVWQQLKLSQSLIRTIDRERLGVAHASVIQQSHEALGHLMAGRPGAEAPWQASDARRLQDRLDALRTRFAAEGASTELRQATDVAGLLVRRLQAAAAQPASAEPTRQVSAQLRAQLQQLMEQVIDEYELVLDSRTDTYYLMAACFVQGTEIAGRLQEASIHGAWADNGSARKLHQMMGKVFQANAELALTLAPPLRGLEERLAQLQVQPSGESIGQAQSALVAWMEVATYQLDRELDRQRSALRSAQTGQILLLALFLVGLVQLGRLIVLDYLARTHEMHRRARLLGHAEELAKIGCAETDLMSDQVRWTSGMFHLFGEPERTDPVDPDWLYLRVPRGERDNVQRNSQHVAPQQPCEFEHRILRSDGSLRTVLHRAVIDLDDKGWPRRALTILQDVTERRDAEQRIEWLDKSCPVTGLFNRKALLERLQQRLGQLRVGEAGLVLMVMQVQQLGLVMDSLGYDGGDRLLQLVARRLEDAAGKTAIVLAHLGQGEYACLRPVPAGVDPQALLEDCRALLQVLNEPVQLGDVEFSLSCSLGFSQAPLDSDEAPRLLHQAQAALGQARDSDGLVCRYDPAAHARSFRRLETETALRRALEQNGLHLHFQPQLELRQGRIVGAEVLARWTDPARGDVAPVEFIAVAEACGLIVELGEWVLRQACLQAVTWQKAGLRPIRLAVNLSARQLQLPDIAWRVQNILRETGMDPRWLGIEITESLFIEESQHILRALHAIKALGVEISLDDFGTGYSNLGYLRRLPVDIVKIDRSIVHDVEAAEHDVSMTRAVINMAHNLQLTVLAEGVETEGQLAMLMANKCDQMQGFFFSKGVEADAFEAMLRSEQQLPRHLFATERRRTLLLVDDEENIVAALRRLLRRDGYQILTANSGSEGLQCLAEHEVDVIISDQRMPGMTGVEFLRRAKELYPDTVRMVLSGYTELQSITDAINEGAIYKFLTKPWDDERLRAHVQEAFRSKELADENKRLDSAVTEANQELAQVNRRLQQLLQSQHERISREETSLQVMRELLESVPLPIIGADQSGMISYANEASEHLFRRQPAPVGRFLDEVLPEGLQTLWSGPDDASAMVHIDGHGYRAVCRSLWAPGGVQAMQRGRLLVLMPVVDERECI
ncbi:EAL domain-containing protein [Roseateles sp. DB2]|uniref:EAL domain-containing protein n=1 Tax=Roseateles sp. DB2 TaxID=3453717 RepID=UPI003EEC5111